MKLAHALFSWSGNKNKAEAAATVGGGRLRSGSPLHLLLVVAGIYAYRNSSNDDPNQPYGLDRETREFIERGYKAGESGVFDMSDPVTLNK